MHELSIVMGIIDIAEKEAKMAGVSIVEEIELEIGLLSGVEMEALEFAWNHAIKNTILSEAKKTIIRPEGSGVCLDCNSEFRIEHLFDPCPHCQSYFINIKKGKELKVKSIVV
ncbi:MAG: hydrogenase maturation nickel metallochaperone HypA [Saprospiraceae bacterium]|jgi:hydrogenase nickel incorporation protein HypA/HybF|nr:hydrogenase maturation nickel metallochaperone HypA [Saprospiraceae bacterium]MBL0025335.1 hydrogenase maturation nickel metallochaperone HypA [Saprospiraceae bacterium]